MDGYLSPALLSGRVAQIYKRGFTRGQAGELGDLARIGQLIKQKVPDSGTAVGNAVVGAMTGGSIPLGVINPALGAANLALTGGGLAANRAIQSRNINPAVLQRAMNPAAAQIGQPLRSGIAAGSILGNLQQ